MVVGLTSDPSLLADLRRYGAFDTAGCYQCGGCSVSCRLVAGPVSFHRKSIRYGLLGLRAPLVRSLEPWICHDCGDCSAACPRGADPRSAMATARRFLTAQYDWTGLSSRLLRSRVWYVGSHLVVAAITVALILWYHLSHVGLKFSQMIKVPLGPGHMFPIMTYYTLVVVLLPLLLVGTHACRMWCLTVHRAQGARIPLSSYPAEVWRFAYHSVTQGWLRRCGEPGRWLGHWTLAIGTALMLGIKVLDLRWFQTNNIYPLYHPQRWLGYLGAGLILYGLGAILAGRVRRRAEYYRETRFEDLVFPILLLLTAISGLAVHVCRYAGLPLTSHFAYAAHIIVATPMLVVELPFGRWSHMIYRPLALYLQAVKERAARRASAPRAMDHAA